jgi:hypothetical protein
MMQRSLFLAFALALATTSLHASAPLTPEEERALPPFTAAATPGQPITLWVESSAFNAQRALPAGTPLRAGPSAEAEIVRTFSVGDGFAIQRVDGAWTQIRFYSATPASAVAKTQDGTATVAATRSGTQVVTSPAARPVNEAPPPLLAPAEPVVVAPAPVTRATSSVPSTVSEPANPIRTFAGRLVRTRGFLFTRAPAPYELINEAGERIVFVDLSKILRTLDDTRLLNRLVHVQGIATAARNGRDTMVVAELVTLR